MQNHKTTIGPIIGSGVVVLVLIFGAVSLMSKVFRERRQPIVLPTITEYERTSTSTIETSTTSSPRP